MILEPRKIKSAIVSPSICHEVVGPDAMILPLSQIFHSPLSLSSKGSLVLLHFLSLSHFHNGVITDLEPDILECEVNWALESITTNKASGGDRIPVELFQILKDDAVKMLHSICQQNWKTAVATGLEKVSFHSNPKERQCQRMLKLLHNCTHLTC